VFCRHTDYIDMAIWHAADLNKIYIMKLEVGSKHNLDFRSTATVRSHADLKNWNTLTIPVG